MKYYINWKISLPISKLPELIGLNSHIISRQRSSKWGFHFPWLPKINFHKNFIFFPVPIIGIASDSNMCPLKTCTGKWFRDTCTTPRGPVAFTTPQKLKCHIRAHHPRIHLLSFKFQEGTGGKSLSLPFSCIQIWCSSEDCKSSHLGLEQSPRGHSASLPPSSKACQARWHWHWVFLAVGGLLRHIPGSSPTSPQLCWQLWDPVLAGSLQATNCSGSCCLFVHREVDVFCVIWSFLNFY